MKNTFWNQFEKTGQISEYLKYKTHEYRDNANFEMAEELGQVIHKE